ncbi:hypothetical protein [Actinokineospora iranica]|uniref:Beta-Ig-H3/fasciclin n=1 Tax=Actinokineospora iranica TaxID=1271860 RepID=A0A1G6UB81_9PSEU|nr:hypothetical protein [Actinokineospora iranica]SDD37847.1 hypothetical protein SAMN05216174_110169 [Actinokineospora iranica]
MKIVVSPVKTAIMALVVGGVSLAAAPTATATENGVTGTAPACVSRNVYATPNGFDVFLQNNCGGTMSVKVIVNNGGDSPCYVMGAGTSKTFIYEGVFGTYDKTVTC